MTLCLAAVCCSARSATGPDRIVFGSDHHAETGWVGGDVAFKFSWLGRFGVLMAGEMSKAFDLITTARRVFAEWKERDENPNTTNILDLFNDVSASHKEKLCRRYVRHRLGIDFDRFLTDGENEIPAGLRGTVFNELAELDYGCSLLIFGFMPAKSPKSTPPVLFPRLIEIDSFGEVFMHQNFGALGTGAIIAKSNLYQRQQQYNHPVTSTIYHLYESAKLAHAGAPGVGEVDRFIVATPQEDGTMHLKATTDACIGILGQEFEKVAPKPIERLPVLHEKNFFEITIKPTGRLMTTEMEQAQTKKEKSDDPPNKEEPKQLQPSPRVNRKT